MNATARKMLYRTWLALWALAGLSLVNLTPGQSQPTVPAAEAQRSPRGATAHAQPLVIACQPENGETEVDPGLSEITLTFDSDMTATTAWTEGRETNSPPTPAGLRPRWRDRCTWALPVKLEAGHYYRLQINRMDHKDFRGANGQPAGQFVLCFTTRGATPATQAKLIKPKVIRLMPPNGATDVDPKLKEVRVTFDIPMARGYSWGGHIWSRDLYPGHYTNDAHWLDAHTCALPVTLKPNHQYTLGINGARGGVNFQSANGGVPCAPVDYSFKTRPYDNGMEAVGGFAGPRKAALLALWHRARSHP
jgi:hypothetical protein